VNEVYNNVVDLDSGTDITIAAGATATGIDASLNAASKISGTVTGPDEFTPLENIQAVAFHWNEFGWWDQVGSVHTDSDGNYTIGGLAAGTYRVEFRDWYGNYLPEVYDNASDLDSGTDIVVAAGTTETGIDASLNAASKISGTVTGPDEFTPLENIQAVAFHWNEFGWWDQVGSVHTDSEGNYTIGGLAAGTYRVEFRDWHGNYLPEVYDNASDLDSGTDIVVAAGTTETGIDASLAAATMISGTVTGSDGAPQGPVHWKTS
jgi:hypothetical protein